MSLDDNIDKVAFTSTKPIDKIVDDGQTISIVNDGNTVGTSFEFQESKIVTQNIPHSYGEKCFVMFVWSIDGTNFNSAESRLVYAYTMTDFGVVLGGLRGAVSVGVSNTEIKFRTANGLHGAVSGFGPFSYTPVSQTFTIKYKLFEIE